MVAEDRGKARERKVRLLPPPQTVEVIIYGFCVLTARKRRAEVNGIHPGPSPGHLQDKP